MPINVEPNLDKDEPEPYERADKMESLGDQARVMGNTALLLKELGADFDMTEDDVAQAEDMIAHAKLDGGDQVSEPKKAKQDRKNMSNPGVALAIGHIVSYYDKQVIEDKVQLRNMAVNKFTELLQSDDEKVQLKAAEMLGKAGDLFVEHSEVTITHKTSDELKSILRERIQKLMQKEVIDVTPKTEMLINSLDNPDEPAAE